MHSTELISSIRAKFNLSQEELARYLKISYTTINAWETGKRRPQEHMLSVLLELNSLQALPTDRGLATNQGLVRSDAGYVSSVLDYRAGKDPNLYTHGIGRWYGCLPSFLVSDLIDFITTDFNNTGEALVNFSGSGTVALELGLHGRECIAIDVNPTALALTSAKTTGCRTSINLNYSKLKEDLLKSTFQNTATCLPSDNLLAQENKWLTQSAKLELTSICNSIAKVEDPRIRSLLAISAANIVVDFCNIDKRCTNHYVYKQNDSFSKQRFIASLIEESKVIEENRHSLSEVNNYIEPTVQWGDACSLPFEDDRFSLVFSHPPYGTTVNYYSISRMQSSIIELVSYFSGELGCLSLKRCKETDISSGTLKRFNERSSDWISEAARVLRRGGLFLVIIGDSRDGGKLSHPFTQVISDGEKNGLILKEIFIWLTNQKSGMHVKRKGNHIDHNYVIIMEKQND